MYSLSPQVYDPNRIDAHLAKLDRMGLGDAVGSLGGSLMGAGVSAGVALATSAASLWLSSINLSHQADTATTQIVNGLEPLLNANKNAYLAGPGTCSDQAAALAAYDTAIAWLRSPKACGNGAYGSAGNRCISDRIGSGARFPWDDWYRGPIANDPRAAACAATASGGAASASAEQNIYNLISGSLVQTAPGQFSAGSSGSSGSSGSGGGAVDTSSVSNFFTQLFLGIPLWVWLAGFGVLIAVI